MHKINLLHNPNSLRLHGLGLFIIVHLCGHSFCFFPVPVDLSPEERSELEDIRRRKGVLLQEIQRLREELRDAILEVEGLEASTEGR